MNDMERNRLGLFMMLFIILMRETEKMGVICNLNSVKEIDEVTLENGV